MEGSNKLVDEYAYLAKYYDYLLSDEEALSLWLKYIKEKDFKTVLELASGSGIMAKILKNEGYEVIASDISEDMKEASKLNYDGEYLILNMIDFKLDKRFDLIICICDSINYLYFEELEKTFKNIYDHLNPNGRFIFDMHHPNRLQEFKEEYIEEGQIEDNVYYQWTINSDIDDSSINEHFTFYVGDDMIQEHHTQNVFMIEDVKKILEKVGFNVRTIEDFVEDEKVLFIGNKDEKVV